MEEKILVDIKIQSSPIDWYFSIQRNLFFLKNHKSLHPLAKILLSNFLSF